MQYVRGEFCNKIVIVKKWEVDILNNYSNKVKPELTIFYETAIFTDSLLKYLLNDWNKPSQYTTLTPTQHIIRLV